MNNSLKRKATDALTPTKKSKANGDIASFFGGTPKPKPAASTTAASTTSSTTTSLSAPAVVAAVPALPAAPKKPFSKDEWLAKLSEEQKELLKLEIDTLHDSWLPYLATEIASKEFLELKRFLKKEHDAGKKVFPPAEDVYSWYVHFNAAPPRPARY